jgi:hypothetical protein
MPDGPPGLEATDNDAPVRRPVDDLGRIGRAFRPPAGFATLEAAMAWGIIDPSGAM